MTLRFVNSALFYLFLAALFSGLYGIVWTLDGWVYELHRIAAWAILALLPWKAAIAARSLRRGLCPNFRRGLVPLASLLLATALLAAIMLALLWTWRLGAQTLTLWWQDTLISWHWVLAVSLLPLFLFHVLTRRPGPHWQDTLSRRKFLQTAGVTAAGLAGWQVAEWLAESRLAEGVTRAPSGSRLNGFLTGNDFPETTNAGFRAAPQDADAWRLRVTGAVSAAQTLDYAAILALPHSSRIAALDCTVGWYSVQRWGGIPLADVLALAGLASDAFAVRFHAAGGYTQTLTMVEAADVLLAVHVGGEPLSHRHGFPLRAVVPSRRGWFWVKWLEEIEALAGQAVSATHAGRRRSIPAPAFPARRSSPPPAR
ncbi:MAG: molybdopterin-dependent oxidoreductase [Chloroflexi bacterium]|nr:molybdopterin-dependent oxidoreductase [Chloroflexota bacterium]